MSSHYDLLVTNTAIVDGTGKAAFQGSVAIQGERIVAVGDIAGEADHVIDGTDLITCPGFVDSHSHADLNVLRYPLLENLVMQGVTTFVGGNCGLAAAPYSRPQEIQTLLGRFGCRVNEPDWRTFGEWLAKVDGIGISLNYVPLAGQNAIRMAAMGDSFRRGPTADEIGKMKRHLADAMENGAFGLSAGYDPGPGEYTTMGETLELARMVRENDGIFTPHTRFHQDSWVTNDPDLHGYGLMHSYAGEVITGRYHGLLEAVEIARQSGVRLLIAHFTPAYIIPQPQPEFLQEAAAKATLLEIVDRPRQEGVDLFFNVIAHPASIGQPAAIIDSFLNPNLALPGWLRELDQAAFVELLKDRPFRERVRGVFLSGQFKIWMVHPAVNPYWMDCFRVVRCRNDAYEGRTIGEIARKRSAGSTREAVYRHSVETLFDVLIEDPQAVWGLEQDIRENMAALRTFIQHPLCMPCSDTYGLPAESETGALTMTPPIAFGLYPYYLRTFVQDTQVLTMEQAIKKATYLPAQQVFGLEDRGIIRRGAYADILVFDPRQIGMNSDLTSPARPPSGIKHVLVNGKLVYNNGIHTQARAGKVLRRRQP